MSRDHVHISDERAFELASEPGGSKLDPACAVCAAAVAEHSRLMADLRGGFGPDGDGADLGDWEAVLMRKRIREAIDREPVPAATAWPPSWVRSGSWAPWMSKPVLAGALAVGFALLGGLPLLRDAAPREEATEREATLPAWTALPELDEDDSFDVLSAWTLTDEEIDLAGCASGLCDSELAVIESDSRQAASGAGGRT